MFILYALVVGIAFAIDCPPGTYLHDSRCLNCTIGYYKNEPGTASCKACALGQYQDTAGQSNCKKCRSNLTTFVMGSTGVVRCTPCLEGSNMRPDRTCGNCSVGYYVDNRACASCPAGYDSTGLNAQCERCPRGQYSVGASACRDCTGKNYQNEAGQSSCKTCNIPSASAIACGACPTGRFLKNSACEQCPTGYRSRSQQTSCTKCVRGHYQDEQGQHLCKTCAPGSFQSDDAGQLCTPCERGTYQTSRGQKTCSKCPTGWYQAEQGQGTCDACPSGQSSTPSGLTSEASCGNCSIGTYSQSGGRCEECHESTYQDEEGQHGCKVCPPSTDLSEAGSKSSASCFSSKGLVTFVVFNTTITDSKGKQSLSRTCEIRPNLLLLCPGCRCTQTARDGFWASPVCDECSRGYAQADCKTTCPGYDGSNDDTICSGMGQCWFGKGGNGQCYCGGHSNIDTTAENIVVDVTTCASGEECDDYQPQDETQYKPIYYIMRYRQYSVFVVKLTDFTPTRGHMWFKRYPQATTYLNDCSMCTGKYELSDNGTHTGAYNTSDYHKFPPMAQSNNGFHGENCQYECGLCIGGQCLHRPHPYRFEYTVKESQGFKEMQGFIPAVVPQTTCECTSDEYDADAMCCPHGFEPYIKAPEGLYSHTPYLTTLNTNLPTRPFQVDKDLWILQEYGPPPYSIPPDGQIRISSNQDVENVSYIDIGPFGKHVFYGTQQQLCRACPGLFGKGVKSGGKQIETYQQAISAWWARASPSRKCNGIGQCDFYAKHLEARVGFMGQKFGSARLESATNDRFDTCFTYTRGEKGVTIDSFNTVNYTQGQDPFLGGPCPMGYFCTNTSKAVGYKEACPAGYYQNRTKQSRVQRNVFCAGTKVDQQAGRATYCQRNTATIEPDDFVDKVCTRCPPNHYAPKGAAVCQACPRGKVKKLSGTRVVGFQVYNTPNDGGTAPWYYIPNETGEEDEDCVLMPRGVIHIPTANNQMSHDRRGFLPIVTCPYGFTSRVGTFIFSTDVKAHITLKLNENTIEAPYVHLKDNDAQIWPYIVSHYCNECPSNTVTGQTSTTCTTCYSNQFKLYTKEMLKIIAVGPLPRTYAGGSVETNMTRLHNVRLEKPRTLYCTGTNCASYTMDVSTFNTLANCIVACQMLTVAQPEAYGFTETECICGVSGVSGNSSFTGEMRPGSHTNTWHGLPLCIECNPGTYRNPSGVCTKCQPGKYIPSDSAALVVGRCLSCPSGWVQDQVGTSNCTACSAGTYQQHTAQSACDTCPSGWWPNNDQSACDTCPSGWVQDQVGTSNCTACSAGTYQQDTAQSACDTCPSGWVSNNDQSACDTCPSGWVSNNDQSACTCVSKWENGTCHTWSYICRERLGVGFANSSLTLSSEYPTMTPQHFVGQNLQEWWVTKYNNPPLWEFALPIPTDAYHTWFWYPKYYDTNIRPMMFSVNVPCATTTYTLQNGSKRTYNPSKRTYNTDPTVAAGGSDQTVAAWGSVIKTGDENNIDKSLPILLQLKHTGCGTPAGAVLPGVFEPSNSKHWFVGFPWSENEVSEDEATWLLPNNMFQNMAGYQNLKQVATHCGAYFCENWAKVGIQQCNTLLL